MTNSKHVLDELMDFRVEVVGRLATIEEHLKNQNGRIGKVEKQSNWNNTKILLGMGGLTALSLIATAKAVGII